MTTKKFTFKTKEGSWRFFLLFVTLILLFSLCAQLIVQKAYKINVSHVIYEVRGAELSMELYKPMEVDSNDSLPLMILANGGSESLPAVSMVAWELAKRGFVVLAVNAYSMGLSDQPAINDSGAGGDSYTFYSGGAQGMYDALEYARTIKYVDQTRIGFWAHSAGRHAQTAAIILDGELFTMNDRMLNVLYNDFGIEITEEQLTENADDIAAAVLSEDQLDFYNFRKTQEQDIYDRYVKAARTTERAFGQKAIVAGHEVIRDPQVNILVGLGTHEEATGSFYLGTTDQYKSIFHTGTEDVVRNGWYEIPDYSMDPTATSTQIGEAFTSSVLESPELKAAIDNRSARMFLSPETFHNGMLWDPSAVSQAVDFFTQALEFNGGDLGAADATPIASKNLASSYIALTFTTLSLVALIGMLVALASILLKTEFFAACAVGHFEPRMTTKDTAFYIAAILAVVAGFVGAYFSSDVDLGFKWSNATMTKWLPWEPGQMRTFMITGATALVGLLLFVVLAAISRKRENDKIPTLKEMNIKFGLVPVLKTALLSVILIAAAYASAAFIRGAFNSRFLFVDGSFEVMKPYSFMRMFKYALILLPFTLIISTLNNLVILKNVSSFVDNLINVVVYSLGGELVVILALILTYSSPQHPVVWNVHATLSLLVLIPITNYLYKKLFKLTGSVWAGAIMVALILGWRSASYISHQFMYWGPNTLAAFWGIY